MSSPCVGPSPSQGFEFFSAGRVAVSFRRHGLFFGGFMGDLNNCVWMLAPATIASNAYCFCGEPLSRTKDKMGEWAVVLWDGRTHRHTCDGHVVNHCPTLDAVSRRLNGKFTRHPNYRDDSHEEFQIMFMPETVPIADADMPCEAEILTDDEYKELCRHSIDGILPVV